MRAVNLKNIYDTSKRGGSLEFGTDVSWFVVKQNFEGDTLKSQHFLAKNIFWKKFCKLNIIRFKIKQFAITICNRPMVYKCLELNVKEL